MAHPAAIYPGTAGKQQPRRADELIATLAERQHGVVARRQLLAAGVGAGAIERRLERGSLRAVEWGIYALGHRLLSEQGRWMVAVLVGAPGSALSYRSAAAAAQVLRSPRRREEVTVDRSRRPRPGIVFHRAALPADEVTIIDGIPATIASRTVLDLARVTDRRTVERALREVEVRRLYCALSLPDLLARYPRHRGSPLIRAILGDRSCGQGVAREELEERFLAFVERAGLPRPELNADLWLGDRWIRPDALWRAARLIVELDGRQTHGLARAFEDDRLRDRAAVAAGWRVVRVTWRQLHHDADALERDLRMMLGC